MLKSKLILAGDIGGTNARFGCLERKAGGGWAVHDYAKYKCSDFDSFDAALGAYIDGLYVVPSRASFAAAGPVEADCIALTNTDWKISSRRVIQQHKFEVCALYNDFAGMTRSVVELGADNFKQLRGGLAKADEPILVAGAGTGFGVGYLVPIKGKDEWQVMSTEGGRVAYSPQTPLEFELSQILRREHDFISLELVNSGKALAGVHKAMCEIHGVSYAALSPDLIRQRAEVNDPVCRDICHIRAAATMTAIGDLVLSGGARGGVVIAGGVSERMVDYYMQPAAMNRYLQRGSLTDYIKGIPMRLLTSSMAPLIGAAVLIEDRA